MESIDLSKKIIQEFVFTSKYARYLPDKKRRETWEEAVERVRNMHIKKYKGLDQKFKDKIIWAFELVKQKRVLPSMRSLQFGGKAIEVNNARLYNCSVRILDSVRAFAEIGFLMLCGTGTGIGLYKKYLSRLPDLVNADDKTGSIINYTVEDSIEGWADALEALLNCYFRNNPYSGRKIVFDFSKIRKKGSILKTGGGRAPGYKPLKAAFIRIKQLLDHIIEHKKINRIRPIDCYDILMYFADCVLSGGIRRTASCIVFDKDDQELIFAKTVFSVDKFRHSELNNLVEARVWVDGLFHDVEFDLSDKYDKYSYDLLLKDNKISWSYIYPQRGRSNNSILLLRDKITFEEYKSIFDRTRQFGEPGFVWADHEDTMYNPCQPKWAKVLTPNGIREIKDVNIGDEIWSSQGWTKITNKWSTGINEVYKYTSTAGVFYGTKNHKLMSGGQKIEAQHCESVDILTCDEPIGDMILDAHDVIDGLVLGDGSVHKASNNLVHLYIGENDNDYFDSAVQPFILKHRPGLSKYAYEVNTTITHNELPLTYYRRVPDRFLKGNRAKVAGFLRGLYSANGSVCDNRITLKSASLGLIEDVQCMLSYLGIKSYYTTNKPTVVTFHNGDFACKQSYDLNITSDRARFFTTIGFLQQYKLEKLYEAITSVKSHHKEPKRTFDITSVDLVSIEETFDLTVENSSHTYWTQCCNVSNCFEVGFIPVTEDGRCGVQMCNLTSTNGAKINSLSDFQECVEAQTIIGTLQATYTNFHYLSGVAKELTESEYLLGNSISGIFDSPDILLDPNNLQKMSKFAVEVNKEWAKILGIKPAARICLQKPEGTGSWVIGSSSGAHPHHSRKFIRRIQSNKDDPVYMYFQIHNNHLCEESSWSVNKTDDVIAFPIVVDDRCIIKDDLTAIKHLEFAKMIRSNWILPSETNNKKPVHHNVSLTIRVGEDEWDDVIKYFYEERHNFSAVSFVPKSDTVYKQAPFQAITNEEESKLFNTLLLDLKDVDYLGLVENSDDTNLMSESSCVGGKCEL